MCAVAVPLWQLSLKCIRREMPSQLADASADDFPSDGGKYFDFAWLCLRRHLADLLLEQWHLRNGCRGCTEKGAARVLRALKNSTAGSSLAQLPAPFWSLPSASLYLLSQTGFTNALSIRTGCCSSSQLSWLVCSQEKTEVCSVCVCISGNQLRQFL